METFTTYAPLLAGLYLLLIAVMMDTSNFRSALLFQFVPLLLGLSCIFTTAKMVGWV